MPQLAPRNALSAYARMRNVLTVAAAQLNRRSSNWRRKLFLHHHRVAIIINIE